MKDFVLAAEGKKNCIYDLVAVSRHVGQLGSGHYTAIARNEVDGEWYNFDDSRVRKLKPEEQVSDPSAYVVFYIRQDLRPANWA